MKKVAILISNGFEEGETLPIVDVMRRAKVPCDLISAQGEQITSLNGVRLFADKLLDDSIKEYDMLIIPGGLTHVEFIADNAKSAKVIEFFDDDPEKYVATICSGAVALAKLNRVKGRKLTSYPAPKYDKWFTEADYSSDMIVIDDKLVTCRGPVTSFALAYTLLDLLGEDGDNWRQRMLYKMLRASKF